MISPRFPRPSSIGMLFAGLALTAACAAGAQTAPQLLPYTVKLIAGGGTAAIAKGATCPVSGNISTDAYGDGCLATEIQLKTAGSKIYYGEFPGFAIADATGAIFFSDGYDGLVRRIDPTTGIVTAVAGGASSSPASGTACGTYTSTDSYGDGCLSTAVKLDEPAALAFDKNGNLYVSDVGYANIREIAATGGIVPTTGGVITNVAGGSTYGYKVNNTAGGPVIAATQSYLDYPFGLAFDAAGNLYVADEGDEAIMVINLTGATETLQGVSIPAGTIEKLMGWGSYAAKTSTADCPSYTSTSSRGGCYYGLWTEGAAAISSQNDAPYQLAVVPGTTAANAGYIYFANEFEDNVGQISSTNIITTYLGQQGTPSVKTTGTRAVGGTFAMGSPFGVAADTNGNVYATDASNGVVWRVDQASKSMYVVAGGATTVCTAATDANGDGCPALQAKFGSSAGSGGYAGSAPPAPGIFGISVDAYADLFVGDTETSEIREIASGTQFGAVGANQPTNIVDVHFAAGDSPISFTISAGATNFRLGTIPSPITNSDGTTDYLIPITATPTVLGPFSGTLQVISHNAPTSAPANFPLNGNYVPSPLTRTTAVVTGSSTSCTGSATTYITGTAVTLTANIGSTGSPTGSVQFYANGNPIPAASSGQKVTNGVATLSYTFTTPGSYSITAVYSGDTYYLTSTSAPVTVTIANPNFAVSLTPLYTGVTASPGCPTGMTGQCTVAPGQTALYSFNITGAYGGSVTFSCSGLPAGTACNFNPIGNTAGTGSVTTLPCTSTEVEALSITTTAPVIATAAGFAAGTGRWTLLGALLCAFTSLLVLQRRKRNLLARVTMALLLLVAAGSIVACGSGSGATLNPGTPAGSYTITVSATGSTGSSTTITVPLIVN